MGERNLVPGEDEREMVDRIAALVVQKLLLQQDTDKPPVYEERKPRLSSEKKPQVLSDSKEATRLIKGAEVREREGLKRQIVKIAQRLDFTAEFDVPLERNVTVDISLKKNNATIACFMFNCGNLSCGPSVIENCTQSNFDHILICSPGKIQMENLHKILGELVRQVTVITLDNLRDFLKDIGLQNLRTEDFLKGRKVIVEYKRLSEEEAELKSNVIKRILMKAKNYNLNKLT